MTSCLHDMHSVGPGYKLADRLTNEATLRKLANSGLEGLTQRLAACYALRLSLSILQKNLGIQSLNAADSHLHMISICKVGKS